jgi:hypothetical protein
VANAKKNGKKRKVTKRRTKPKTRGTFRVHRTRPVRGKRVRSTRRFGYSEKEFEQLVEEHPQLSRSRQYYVISYLVVKFFKSDEYKRDIVVYYKSAVYSSYEDWEEQHEDDLEETEGKIERTVDVEYVVLGEAIAVAPTHDGDITRHYVSKRFPGESQQRRRLFFKNILSARPRQQERLLKQREYPTYEGSPFVQLPHRRKPKRGRKAR